MDAIGKMDHSSCQKITTTLHIIALDVIIDARDVYHRMSENMATKYMKWFYIDICVEFGNYKFWQPTKLKTRQTLG